MRKLSLAKSPYRYYLEEDENFRRWVEALEALERGSVQTAANYFRKTPSANHYDFGAYWTLSTGQVVTAVTSSPLQVVGGRRSPWRELLEIHIGRSYAVGSVRAGFAR